MDIQNRRVTRSTAESQENQARQGLAKDMLRPTRRAFADQRNTRIVAKRAEVKKVVAVQPVRRVSPISHPEVSGIEREFSAVEFTEDVHNYLLSKEANFVPKTDIMAGKVITPKMRGILIDWLVQVHGRFHLFPETLHLTVHLIDCALDRLEVEKSKLQLVGVAAMLVASKFEEMYVPDISDFEFITDNTFTRRQIIKMEPKILQACDLQLSRPHSITFLRWISKELGISGRQHALAKYFGEIALIDYTMLRFLPSQTAAISIYMVSRMTGAEIDTNKMMTMVGWSQDEMVAGAHRLAQATLRLYSQEKLQALQSKYSTAKHSSVSNFTDEEFLALQDM